jgi:hypothetical protein
MKKIIAEYRIELLALLAALVGVFLLVEQLPLRQVLSDLLARLVNTGRQTTSLAATGVNSYISSFSLSDMLGWITIVLVGAFITWRVLPLHPHRTLEASVCHAAAAIRRPPHTFDRFLGTFCRAPALPLQRHPANGRPAPRRCTVNRQRLLGGSSRNKRRLSFTNNSP